MSDIGVEFSRRMFGLPGAQGMADQAAAPDNQHPVEAGQSAELARGFVADRRDVRRHGNPGEHAIDDRGGIADGMAVAWLGIDAIAAAVAVNRQVERLALIDQRSPQQMLDGLFATQQGHAVADVVDGIFAHQIGDWPTQCLLGRNGQEVAEIGRHRADQPIARQAQVEARRLDHLRRGHAPKTRSKIRSIRLK